MKTRLRSLATTAIVTGLTLFGNATLVLLYLGRHFESPETPRAAAPRRRPPPDSR
jgi:hypothetical protein